MQDFDLDQQRAINAPNGLWLSAGAGSGKTSVLVERVLCQLQAGKAAQTIVITFTVKAAAEMEHRLKRRIQQLPDALHLETQLNKIFIGTIHALILKYGRYGIPSLEVVAFEQRQTRYLNDWQHFLKQVESSSQVKEIISSPQFAEWLAAYLLNAQQRWHHAQQSWEQAIDREKHLRAQLWQFFEFWFAQSSWRQQWTEAWIDQEGEPINWPLFLSHLADRPLPRSKKDQQMSSDLKQIRSWHKRLASLLDDKSCFSAMDLMKEVDEIVREFIAQHQMGWSASAHQCFGELEYHLALGLSADSPNLIGLMSFKLRQEIERGIEVILDEAQDTSPLQLWILEQLVRGQFERIFAVGDLKQAIYGFRGAATDRLSVWLKQLPVHLSLSYNYRSAPALIAGFNQLFAELAEQTKTELAKIPPHLDDHLDDEVTDNFNAFTYDGVQQQLELIEQQLIASIAEQANIAILCHTNDQVKSLALYLSQCGIYAKANLKLALEHHPFFETLTWVCYAELAQITKIPDQENKLINKARWWLEQLIPTTETASPPHSTLMSDYNAYLQHWGQLAAVEYLAAQFRCSSHLGSLLSMLFHQWRNLQLELYPDPLVLPSREQEIQLLLRVLQDHAALSIDLWPQEQGAVAVNLMTIHASKGLEFDHVLLPYLQRSPRKDQPHWWLDRSGVGDFTIMKWEQGKWYSTLGAVLTQVEQERAQELERSRLLYVACTRAKKKLIVFFDGEKIVEPELESISVLLETPLNQLNQLPQVLQPSELRSWSEQLKKFKQWNIHYSSATESENKNLLLYQRNSQQVQYLRTHYLSYQPKPISFWSRGRSSYSAHQLSQLGWCAQSFQWSLQGAASITREHVSGGSSLERGQLVHRQLQDWIEGTSELPWPKVKRDWLASEFDLIKQSLNHECFYLPEHSLGYQHQGISMSATVDLLIHTQNVGGPVAIVDYKTGQPNTQQQVNYQFQLYWYAWAARQYFPQAPYFQLYLFYLDQQRVVTHHISTVDLSVLIADQFAQLKGVPNQSLERCHDCRWQKTCFPTTIEGEVKFI